MTPPAATLDHAMSSEHRAADQLVSCVSGGTVIRFDEPLAKRTTLRVGGPADVFVEPASEADLGSVIRFCGGDNWPWFVLGRGFNLLVRGGGFRGVVFSLGQFQLSRIEI